MCEITWIVLIPSSIYWILPAISIWIIALLPINTPKLEVLDAAIYARAAADPEEV